MVLYNHFNIVTAFGISFPDIEWMLLFVIIALIFSNFNSKNKTNKQQQNMIITLQSVFVDLWDPWVCRGWSLALTGFLSWNYQLYELHCMFIIELEGYYLLNNNIGGIYIWYITYTYVSLLWPLHYLMLLIPVYILLLGLFYTFRCLRSVKSIVSLPHSETDTLHLFCHLSLFPKSCHLVKTRHAPCTEDSMFGNFHS